jgi:phage shock protein C
MKKIININLASRLIPIEESAYEILRQYLDSLKRYFAKEEGGDEIVSDIESRIAEIFQDKLKKGAHCITDEDIAAVKASMGTPEQFDDEPKAQSHTSSDPAGAASQGRPRKRLYRDGDNKILGGVCSGLGAYFNIDPVIFRIVFALLAIGGFGTGILVYFILWVATPEANTVSEKLEMRGERVDLNNIKASIQDEINHMKTHFNKVGEDVRNFSQGRGRQVGSDIERFFHNLIDILGKVLVFFTKGFFYFLAVVILFSLIVAGIFIAASSAALFPLKSALLSTSMQSLLFWPAIILLLGIPIMGIVIFLVRKLTGVKQTNRYVGYTLTGLWFIGLISALLLGISVGKDFRTGFRERTTFAIQQPSNGKLVVKKMESMVDVDEIDFFGAGLRVVEDTIITDNVEVKLEKSNTDSFEVELLSSARGRTVTQAKNYTRAIQFQLQQQDSVLYLPAGVSIPRGSKFRDQSVQVIIKVPVGKKIEVEEEVRNRFGRKWNDGYWNDNWDHGGPIELKMTIDGLNDIRVEKRHQEDQEETVPSKDNYRYKGRGENAAASDSGKSI